MIYDHLEPGDKKLSEKSLFSVHCQGKLKCNEQAGEQSWAVFAPPIQRITVQQWTKSCISDKGCDTCRGWLSQKLNIDNLLQTVRTLKSSVGCVYFWRADRVKAEDLEETVWIFVSQLESVVSHSRHFYCEHLHLTQGNTPHATTQCRERIFLLKFHNLRNVRDIFIAVVEAPHLVPGNVRSSQDEIWSEQSCAAGQ